VGNYETVDFFTSYSGIKDMRLKFGIRNIFNTPPPYTNAGGQTSFQAGYDPQYGDPRGRFVFAGVTYQFK
jgi:iron complex outermembrane receptor protein